MITQQSLQMIIIWLWARGIHCAAVIPDGQGLGSTSDSSPGRRCNAAGSTGELQRWGPGRSGNLGLRLYRYDRISQGDGRIVGSGNR